ncbi:UNKNOWN [Stylonychia lemnae]|uniref:RING-type domain-containing protein n=1 Tax=Stylonychia lemnae TaxID=5949 RepID=A0A078APD2_STYLE|nr:UNKNOWN [Stylonychia lemnae]|eukprot:CDW83989.1 UNKNOWN [Stylonychia lemnae]
MDPHSEDDFIDYLQEKQTIQDKFEESNRYNQKLHPVFISKLTEIQQQVESIEFDPEIQLEQDIKIRESLVQYLRLRPKKQQMHIQIFRKLIKSKSTDMIQEQKDQNQKQNDKLQLNNADQDEQIIVEHNKNQQLIETKRPTESNNESSVVEIQKEIIIQEISQLSERLVELYFDQNNQELLSQQLERKLNQSEKAQNETYLQNIVQRYLKQELEKDDLLQNDTFIEQFSNLIGLDKYQSIDDIISDIQDFQEGVNDFFGNSSFVKFICICPDNSVSKIAGKYNSQNTILILDKIKNPRSIGFQKQEQGIQTNCSELIYSQNGKRNDKSVDVCTQCNKDIYFTDEYICLWDCRHSYHRICLIKHVANVTEKKFYLTIKEQDALSLVVFSICPLCDKNKNILDQPVYKENVIGDLLKEKGQAFYDKMKERLALEQQVLQEELNSKQKHVSPKKLKSISEFENENDETIHHNIEEKIGNYNSRNQIVTSTQSCDHEQQLQRRERQLFHKVTKKISVQSTKQQNQLATTQLMMANQNQEDQAEKPQFILAQTDNMMFTIQKKTNRVVFPNCSCQETIGMESLNLLFGKDVVQKALFKAIASHNLSNGECDNCGAEGLRANSHHCNEDHELCELCYQLEECKACLKPKESYQADDQSDNDQYFHIEYQTELGETVRGPLNYSRLSRDKYQSSRDNSSQIKKQNTHQDRDSSPSKNEIKDHKIQRYQTERNDTKECSCKITKDFVIANFGKLIINDIDENDRINCLQCQGKIQKSVIRNVISNFSTTQNKKEVVKSEVQTPQFKEITSRFKQQQQVLQVQKIINFVDSKCSVCNQFKPSAKICDKRCNHNVCKYCIKQAIVDPFMQEILNRQKIKNELIACPYKDCSKILTKDTLLQLINTLAPKMLQNGIEDKVEILYDQEDEILSFLDQSKWIQICLKCEDETCIVCQNQIDECVCKRCEMCKSANLVKRPQTKSYYCPNCSKHFCEACDQSINQCKCYEKRQSNASIRKNSLKKHSPTLKGDSIIHKREFDTASYQQQQPSGISNFLSDMLDKAFGSINRNEC